MTTEVDIHRGWRTLDGLTHWQVTCAVAELVGRLSAYVDKTPDELLIETLARLGVKVEP